MLIGSGAVSDDRHLHIGESGGLFQHTVDQAAFFDRVILSLWGELKPEPQGIVITENFAVGGRGLALGFKKRLYGRSMHGLCCLTGNPFELRYGVLEEYRKLPPFRLIVRSRNKPITQAEVAFLISSLFTPACRGYLAEAELSFDVSSSRISRSARNLFSCARSQRQYTDESGRRTIYSGTPKSVWMYRQYQKTPGITRLEFVLRRAFLKAHGIRRPCDLLRLGGMDLSPMVSFRTISKAELRAVLARTINGSRKQELVDSFCQRPLQSLTSELRKDGVDLEPLLRECGIQKQLRRMQQQLLW